MTGPGATAMRLVVTGAAGRMGRMAIRAVQAADGITLAAALTHADSPPWGRMRERSRGCNPWACR